MYPVSIGLVVQAQIFNGSLSALGAGCHTTRGLLFRHVALNQHWPKTDDIDLVFILHPDSLREEVIESFSCGISRNIGHWMFGRKRRDIDDSGSALSLQHIGDDIVGHEYHRDAVNVDFIEQALVRNFMDVTYVGDSNIVNQDRAIVKDPSGLDSLEEIDEKLIFLALCEICRNVLCLDFMLLTVSHYLSQRSLHLLLITGDHADVEPQGCELLAETQSNTIATARHNHP